jgi:hypothetical protein
VVHTLRASNICEGVGGLRKRWRARPVVHVHI